MGASQSADSRVVLVHLPTARPPLRPGPSVAKEPSAAPPSSRKRWDITKNNILPWLMAHSFKTNKTVWGGVTWDHIHERSICFPDDPTPEEQAVERQYLDLLAQTLPCPDCRQHAIEYLQNTPPTLETSAAYQNWGFEFHNSVNQRLGKPIMPREGFDEKYRSHLVREQHC